METSYRFKTKYDFQSLEYLKANIQISEETEVLGYTKVWNDPIYGNKVGTKMRFVLNLNHNQEKYTWLSDKNRYWGTWKEINSLEELKPAIKFLTKLGFKIPDCLSDYSNIENCDSELFHALYVLWKTKHEFPNIKLSSKQINIIRQESIKLNDKFDEEHFMNYINQGEY